MLMLPRVPDIESDSQTERMTLLCHKKSHVVLGISTSSKNPESSEEFRKKNIYENQ